MPAGTLFDQSVADEICRRVAAGRELKDVCKEEGMPSFQTVMDWHSANSLFANQLIQAREQMFAKMAADGKEDPRYKTNYTVQRIGNNGSKIASSDAGIILFFVSLCYSLMLLFGFNRYLNFLPSIQWEIISGVISLGLGAIFAVSTAPAVDWVNSLITLSNNKEETGYREGGTSPVISALITSVFFYFLFVYGPGPAITALSSTIVKKDIVGTAHYQSGGRRNFFFFRSYYISTPDLSDHAYTNFYITRDTYYAIGAYIFDVHMHVTLKQSFFGSTVEHYRLSN